MKLLEGKAKVPIFLCVRIEGIEPFGDGGGLEEFPDYSEWAILCQQSGKINAIHVTVMSTRRAPKMGC
jgi:hypothetical protein